MFKFSVGFPAYLLLNIWWGRLVGHILIDFRLYDFMQMTSNDQPITLKTCWHHKPRQGLPRRSAIERHGKLSGITWPATCACLLAEQWMQNLLFCLQYRHGFKRRFWTWWRFGRMTIMALFFGPTWQQQGLWGQRNMSSSSQPWRTCWPSTRETVWRC